MRRWIVGIVAAVLLAGGGLYVYQTTQPKRLPRSVFEKMKFPGGTDFLGDPETGWLCHEFKYWDAAKQEWVLWNRHTIHQDFRDMTPGQRIDAIIEDSIMDTEALELLACARPSEWFPGAAGDAWADPPHCSDCGGGCGTVTCPAHNAPPCRLGGNNCALTFVCCSGSCPTTCE